MHILCLFSSSNSGYIGWSQTKNPLKEYIKAPNLKGTQTHTLTILYNPTHKVHQAAQVGLAHFVFTVLLNYSAVFTSGLSYCLCSMCVHHYCASWDLRGWMFMLEYRLGIKCVYFPSNHLSLHHTLLRFIMLSVAKTKLDLPYGSY